MTETVVVDPAAPVTDPATPPVTDPAEPPVTDPAPAPGAPEAYEAFTLPEGTELAEADLTAVQTFAKDLNLSQEQAQKLVDRDLAQRAAAEKSAADQSETLRTEWETASKSDKEFGGDKFEENLALGKKALDTFGDDELKQFLELSGRGSHPAVLRAFIKVGKAISEDKLVTGEEAPAPARFYANSNHSL